MKQTLLFLLLFPTLCNAQFVNDFTGQQVILPSDTTKINHTYFRKTGTIVYEDSTIFMYNGFRFKPISGSSYSASGYVKLSGSSFYADTTLGKLATQSMLNDTGRTKLPIKDSIVIYSTQYGQDTTSTNIRNLLNGYATTLALFDSVSKRVRYLDSNIVFLTPHDTLNKWVSIGTTFGTVTSISTSTGILGGTITTSGTLRIDSSIVPKWDDTLSGNRWLITVAYLKSFNYGTGTVTSIANGYGILGGTITTAEHLKLILQ